jgi:hypothetical protein
VPSSRLGGAQSSVNDWVARSASRALPDEGYALDPRQSDTTGTLRYLWKSRLPQAPAVLDPAGYAEIAEASLSVLRGAGRLLAMPHARSELARISDFSSAELTVVDDDFFLDPLIVARSDVVLGDEGAKLTEINITSRIAIYLEHDMMAEAIESEPRLREAIDALGLRRLAVGPAVGTLLRSCAQRSTDGAVCIAHGRLSGALRDHYLLRMLCDRFGGLGFATFAAPLTDLEVRRDGLVHPHHGRVSVLYRLFGPSDLTATEPLLSDLRRLARFSRLAVVDGFIGESYASKLLLTLLSNRRWLDKLQPDVAEAMCRYVPWTRLLDDCRTELGTRTIDLLAYTAEHRAELVLKPGRGSGGVWVVIGGEVTQQQWERAIGSALRSKVPWVVQRYLESATMGILVRGPDGVLYEEERSANYSGILIDRTCVGVTRRDGPRSTSVLNSLQGAVTSPVYSFDDPFGDVGAGLAARAK